MTQEIVYWDLASLGHGFIGMKETPDGVYVRRTDHAAEIDRLRAELDNAAAAAVANMSLACEKERQADALRVDAERRGWQPMATAPDDGSTHIRGLWVRTIAEGKPDRSEWRQYVGYLNDYREFVDTEFGESFGWDDDQYEAWMPVAEPPAEQAMGADA